MSTATSTFHPNEAGIHQMLGSPDGMMGQVLTRLCNRIVTTAKVYANVDTGLMRSRIEFHIEEDGFDDLVGVVVAATDYSYWVHEGNAYYEGNPFLTDAADTELGRGLA